MVYQNSSASRISLASWQTKTPRRACTPTGRARHVSTSEPLPLSWTSGIRDGQEVYKRRKRQEADMLLLCSTVALPSHYERSSARSLKKRSARPTPTTRSMASSSTTPSSTARATALYNTSSTCTRMSKVLAQSSSTTCTRTSASSTLPTTPKRASSPAHPWP